MTVVWEATPKQGEFLAANETEVLFGGSAGGGKSAALLVDALGLSQGAVLRPRYKALLLRSSFPQLRELIDRSRELYPQLVRGAEYHEQAREWRFASGSKVVFGYLERDADKYQYQGQEYQYLGIDELTHIESIDTYLYMLSRVRSADPELETYIRATSNPGGKGHAWVKKRFGIGADGAASRVEEMVGDHLSVRRFIPATLQDNPHLANTGYKEQLMMLPEAERMALLEGRWDLVDDAALLVSPKQVQAAAQVQFKDMAAIGPIIVGVDPAYKGKDSSAIIFRRGRCAYNLVRFKGLDNMQLAAKLAQIIKDTTPDAVNIDYGMGVGVYDRLCELGYGKVCNLVSFGGKADDALKYYNKRAEMYGTLADWLAEPPVRIPPDDMLMEELSTVPYERDSAMRLKLRSKDEIKKTLGASPDSADALALTFALPIESRITKGDARFALLRPQGNSYGQMAF